MRSCVLWAVLAVSLVAGTRPRHNTNYRLVPQQAPHAFAETGNSTALVEARTDMVQQWSFSLVPNNQKYIELQFFGPIFTGLNLRVKLNLYAGNADGKLNVGFTLSGSFMFGGFVGFEISLGAEMVLTTSEVSGDTGLSRLGKFAVSSLISAVKGGTSTEPKDAAQQKKIWDPQRKLWEAEAQRAIQANTKMSQLYGIKVTASRSTVKIQSDWTIEFFDSKPLAKGSKVEINIPELKSCSIKNLERYRMLMWDETIKIYSKIDGRDPSHLEIELKEAIPKDEKVIVTLQCTNPDAPTYVRPEVQTTNSEAYSDEWFQANVGVYVTDVNADVDEVFAVASDTESQAIAQWSFNFNPTAAIAAGKKVTISGLKSLTNCENVNHVNSGDDLLDSPTWSSDKDAVTLTVKAGKSLPVGDVMSIEMRCKNPVSTAIDGVTILPVVKTDVKNVPVTAKHGVDIGPKETSSSFHRSSSLNQNMYKFDKEIAKRIRGSEGLCKAPAANQKAPMAKFRSDVCTVMQAGQTAKKYRDDHKDDRAWVGTVAKAFAGAFLVPNIKTQLENTAKWNFTNDDKAELVCNEAWESRGSDLQYTICHMFKYGIFANIFDSKNEKDNIISGMKFQYPFLFDDGTENDELLGKFCKTATRCEDDVGDKWTAFLISPPRFQKGVVESDGYKAGDTQLQTYVRSLAAKNQEEFTLSTLTFNGALAFKLGWESPKITITLAAFLSAEKTISLQPRPVWGPWVWGIGIRFDVETSAFSGNLKHTRSHTTRTFKEGQVQSLGEAWHGVEGLPVTRDTLLELAFTVTKPVYDNFQRIYTNIQTYYPYFEMIVNFVREKFYDHDVEVTRKDVLLEFLGTLYDVFVAYLSKDATVGNVAWAPVPSQQSETGVAEMLGNMASKLFPFSAADALSALSVADVKDAYDLKFDVHVFWGQGVKIGFSAAEKLEVEVNSGAICIKGGVGTRTGVEAEVSFEEEAASFEVTKKVTDASSITVTVKGLPATDPNVVTCVALEKSSTVIPTAPKIMQNVKPPEYKGKKAETAAAAATTVDVKVPSLAGKKDYKVYCVVQGNADVFPSMGVAAKTA